MNKLKHGVLTILLLIAVFSNCEYGTGSKKHSEPPVYSSYRDIPGVTDEEIAAIEAIKAEGQSLSLGKIYSTEAYVLPDGAHAGFSPKLGELVSNLFGITFISEFYELGSLMSGLDNMTIDLTGELVITPERQDKYTMSTPISQRSLAILTYGDRKIEATHDLNGLRVGILERSSVWEFINNSYPELKFEAVPLSNIKQNADMLKSGELDAIISISTTLTYDFGGTEFTLAYDLLPLAYSPVALSTANPKFKPIISVMNKYLAAGGVDKLYELYKTGAIEYKRNSIKKILSDKERAYLENLNAKVPIVLGTDTYPVSFYNENDGEFQGIAIDVLTGISKITGIEFEIINPKDASWGDILEMLKTGKAALISDLIITEERKEYFIWPQTPYYSTPYVFISKMDLPNLELYQIEQARVGVVGWCATYQLFKQWFPNNSNIALYDSQDEALDALGKNEIDLFFNLGYILYYQKNYREKSNYKANYIFPVFNDIFFGLNKNEEILSSIIDKTISYIELDNILNDWMSRSYDYSKALAHTRITYLTIFLAVISLVLLVISILTFIISKNRKVITLQRQHLQSTFEQVTDAKLSLEKTYDILTSVLNKSDIMVYVTDKDTDETLFMNDYMKQQFEIEGDIVGVPCYKLLQAGMNQRCDFCPCHKLDKDPDAVIIWEEQNPITKKYYRKTDRYIDWPGGKKVHIQYSVDITDTKEIERALKVREEMLSAQNKAAVMFLSLYGETFEKMMTAGIEYIADVIRVDRISIFQNSMKANGLHASQIYRWCKKSGGTTPPQKEFIDLLYSSLSSRWENILENNQLINSPISLLPESEAAFLKKFGVVSLLVAPVFINDVFWGFTLFEDHSSERCFEEEVAEMMRSAAFLCVNTVIRNETERKVAEAHMRYEIMLDSTPMCCQLFDSSFKKIDCNQEALRLFGFKNKLDYFERHTQMYPEFQPDGQRSSEKVRKYLEKTLAEGKCSFEWMYSMQDGTFMPAAATMVKLKHENDYVIAVYTRDLREQIRLKNEIEIMFENAPVGLTVFDENFKYIDCNETVLKMYGVTREFYSTFFGSASHSPEFQPDGLSSYEKAMEVIKRVMDGEAMTIEWVHSMPDGQPLPVELTMVRVNRDGKYIGLGYIYDMREQIRLKKEIEAALVKTQEASRAKSNFLSTMSHEMRTPMNAIIGMTAIGKKTNNIDDKNHALNKIGDASSHLLGVINDVLDMAKIEANKLELTPVEFNFEKMLQRVTNVTNFRIDEKLQQFSINIDRNIPNFFVGDDQRLAQVITNLLSNAIKFTPEGGKIQLNASLIGETDGLCELRIEVIDNGIGIASEHHEKLFGMFEQAESGISREYGGTGLGLVISKNIIELMDGKIWVESELGKGTRFTFTIKARRGIKNQRSLLSPGVNWDNVQVLVVDDDLEIHNQFNHIFDILNIKCDTAFDGSEACRMIEEHGEYDIYFIDWRMPGMDGIELTKKIKSRIDGRQSVIIMITAMDWEQIKDEAAKAGVDKHLLKPLFPSLVIDSMNECLGVFNEPRNAEQTYGDFAGKKLLLAEDIEINREVLMAHLEDTGIIIDCAENGVEALNMVTENPGKYDIIFMDVQMPKMDGLEATRRIRALPIAESASLPIIAMTANVFKDDIEACLMAGMDDHIGKPLDVEKILETLSKYLIKKEV